MHLNTLQEPHMKARASHMDALQYTIFFHIREEVFVYAVQSTSNKLYLFCITIEIIQFFFI